MSLGIIKYTKNERREGNLAVVRCRVTFFGIPIYNSIYRSTNNNAVRILTAMEDNKLNIKGFK